jgi:Zn-dependent oligopeptidase
MSLADRLNREYVRLHTAKEDAFWTQKMGLADDPGAAQRDFDAREIELQRFLQDPAQIPRVREALEPGAAPAPDRTALEGWLATFEAHAIESSAARALSEEVLLAEGRLAEARSALELSYEDEHGRRTPASSVRLGALLRSSTSARVRRSAWDGLRAIERGVLRAGFLDVLRMRNRLGRMLGAEDYYDWKTRRVERLSKAEVFGLLDELELATRDRARDAVEQLAARRGPDSIRPWNIQFASAGDSTREMDPYFPFSQSVRRWGESFAALGIRYAGARLVLDLVDRKGKYENGFMHGPVVAWRDHGRRVPARIHFTANAIPGLVGSGFRATETLFHEGGHAAHFANVDMPAPCFGQEFAPTSVGFSETQSMLLDSLLRDGHWRARYARDGAGQAMPWEVHERSLAATLPFAAWQARAMLAVCYAERALYEIPDEELSAERVLEELRGVERRLLFLEEGSPRPALAVPHVLAGESSAYYHGYVLAEMAVELTRDYFLRRDGELCDNPRLGPDLARAYWRPGNRHSFLEFVPRLTGSPLGAGALARRLTQPLSERIASERSEFARAAAASKGPGIGELDLDARITILHGRDTVAELDGDFAAFSQRFAAWIDAFAAGQRAAEHTG